MNHPSSPPTSSGRRLAITVRGVVQGVGFRPFVYQAAHAHGLAGWVRNQSDTVRIEVQGDRAALDAFVEALRHAHPPQARIDAIEIQEMPPIDAADGDGSRSGSLRDSSQHQRGGAPADDPRRSGHLPGVSGRNPRSVRAPLQLSLYQLHQLRPALVDHRAIALRSAADLDGLLRDVRRLSGRVRQSGRPAFSRPADRLSALRPGAATARPRRPRNGRRRSGPDRGRAGAVGRPRGGHQGPRRLPTAGRCDQCRGGRPAAPAKTAARSPLRPDAAVAGCGAAILRSLGRRSPSVGVAPSADRAVARRNVRLVDAALLSPLCRSSTPSPPAIRTWASCCPTRRCTTC